MVNDPIADLLTRIRNGYMAHLDAVTVPHSEMKYSICKILEKNDFIESVENTMDKDDKKQITIGLKEFKKGAPLPNFKRISKPGRRVYTKAEELKLVNSGFGFGIISTPKGLMTNYEARTAKVGGEYLCQVY